MAWRNKKDAVIPGSIIQRPPTAELKPGQKDQDTLPPYEVLDPIMQAYVEENKNLEQIVALGFDAATVKKVMALIDHAESPDGDRAHDDVPVADRFFRQHANVQRIVVANNARPANALAAKLGDAAAAVRLRDKTIKRGTDAGILLRAVDF